MTQVDPVDLIDRACAVTAALFEQKPKLKLIKAIPENLPTLTADLDRIIQVLINLISNAVKFTDSGYVKVGVYYGLEGEEVRSLKGSEVPLEMATSSNLLNRADEVRPAKPRLTSGGQVLNFFVSDTGSGIPPDQLDRVFERFKQVEENQAGKPKGTGLGLPICKEIVEHHGGGIWVESEIDKGVSFILVCRLVVEVGRLQPS